MKNILSFKIALITTALSTLFLAETKAMQWDRENKGGQVRTLRDLNNNSDQENRGIVTNTTTTTINEDSEIGVKFGGGTGKVGPLDFFGGGFGIDYKAPRKTTITVTTATNKQDDHPKTDNNSPSSKKPKFNDLFTKEGNALGGNKKKYSPQNSKLLENDLKHKKSQTLKSSLNNKLPPFEISSENLYPLRENTNTLSYSSSSQKQKDEENDPQLQEALRLSLKEGQLNISETLSYNQMIEQQRIEEACCNSLKTEEEDRKFRKILELSKKDY